ncbi:TMEM175 family protein [uncultured Methanobrevibacter sp.]|uniref:TMEM175 family protein n=1 Tax=uncultured Methanobrevibacter sp. TaxID=253161 RepID=UPI002624B669|nr:TMEM175 family protein [uncultured Methanobrevibacter sp.]
MSINKIFSNNFKERFMAITDGVFAIAMTILVLEIAVPTLSDITSGAVLMDYILEYLLPSILIYFISFYLVYNFWETNVLLFNFKKIKHSILILNMFTIATACLIPFATGFLFKFYYYTEVNILFSLLILIISLLYLIMFILLVRNNFKEYFNRKNEIKAEIKKTYDSYEDGIELDNLKLYIKGTILTLFYILLSPVIISGISLILAFFSPLLSVLSFMLILILRFFIIIRRENKDNLADIELSDDEKEFIENVKKGLYGE